MSTVGAVRKFLLPGIAVIVLLGLLLVLLAFPRAKAVISQPLAFNHKTHIENAGVSCKDCHVNVETMAMASIPVLEVCQNCHAGEPLSKSPVEQELIKYIADKKEIPWVQVHAVPPQVYFSHRRHVTVGGMDCSACHGNIASMTLPVTAPTFPITMRYCMDCHEQHKVTNDCLACHR